jgi:crotonobetainyl-CoA:carnitine CoA-transferase CaiB-like acyl-CoA transferase
MAVTGTPGGPPLRLSGQQSFYAASLYAACAALLAVHKRGITGRGEYLPISSREAVTSTLEHVLVRYFSEGLIPGRTGGDHWNDLFFHIPCKDGFMEMSVFQHWDIILELLERDGAAEDLIEERWRDEDYRRHHKKHVPRILSAWTGNHTRYELFEMGQLMHFPWAPIQTPRDILCCPHLKARNFFTQENIEGRTVSFPGLPFRFSGHSEKRSGSIPEPDGHNRAVHWEEPGRDTSESRVSASEGSPLTPVYNDAEILRKIRVLDFTRVLAGPYATRVFADFGAEVIKVEPIPQAGNHGDRDAYFETWNRNKHSITVNMDRPEGIDIIRKLVRVCDVVVENFSPRVMANWGLSFDVLRGLRPDLIMLSMSGFGQTGPWRDYVAYAPTAHALGGITHLTSFSEGVPLGPGFAYGDIMAALFGAFALLGALENRKRTGEGRFIDLSEYEVICALMGPALLRTGMGFETDKPAGNCPEEAPFYPCGCYRCLGEDRWVVLSVRDAAQWRALCRLVDPSLASDERFKSPVDRRLHRESLDPLIESWTLKYHPEEAVTLLQHQGVPAGVVQNARDVAEDPCHQARNFFVTLEGAAGGTVTSDRTPLWTRHSVPPGWKGAPLPGESNSYVLRTLLGMSEEEYGSYLDKGVIGR